MAVKKGKAPAGNRSIALRWKRLLLSPLGKTLAALMLLACVAVFAGLVYIYRVHSKLIDEKLTAGPFAQTSQIFAAPRTVSVGDEWSLADLTALLRRAGYSESRTNRTGWYHLRPGAIEIVPGSDAYQQEPAVIKVGKDKIVEIVSAQDHTKRTQYELEPELVTSLSDRNREKRRLVKFDDIPKVLVNAVISIEDKRFFHHAGFDPLRMLKALYVDIREGRKKEGASTLSQQLARSFWLDAGKRWQRKIEEVLIAFQLEQRLSKNEIFEYYSNQINLGRRGSFAIHGFGQAAQAYFGKDVSELTLPESAMLAGLIQSPSWYNPFRHPDRMKERRNVVLSLMRENRYITDREYATAASSDLQLSPGGLESTEAPYFVDLVNDELQNRFQDLDFKASTYRIYTTLDINLQNAAAEAVRIGIEETDNRLKKQRRYRNQTPPEAQVALVALDPHTGEVRALIGGRNYGMSQLNRVLAKRPPGSIFKPFVYAAAMNTALDPDAREVITPATKIVDEPTTFWFEDQPYEPGNFGDEYYGEVTVRQALAKSINIPAVKIAEMVGYDKIAKEVRKAGMNLDTAATPAIALGSHGLTPLEMAGGYTIFSNSGVFVKPNWVRLVRAQDNSNLFQYKPETERVLDPRVAYMVVNLMEEVTRSGTAAGIRTRGFGLPAAGKTGTAHDGWFAGFTSKLLCVVWVGFDNYEELHLEGAKSALPIWVEFMKRAAQFPEYRAPRPFESPDGIITVEIDPVTGQLASPNCPEVRSEIFISGSQPLSICRMHGATNLTSTRVTGWDQPEPVKMETKAPDVIAAVPVEKHSAPVQAKAEPAPKPEDVPNEDDKSRKKRGFLGRILGIFK